MATSIQHAAALVLDNANYGLQRTAWFCGKERSIRELRQLAGKPMFPLPPFDADLYEQEKVAAVTRANAIARRAMENEARLQKLFDRKQAAKNKKR